MAHDEDWDDHDAPDDEDTTDDDDCLLACPACRRSVHEDTQQCPHCGEWITPVDAAGHWKRALWVIAAVLLILAMLVPVVL